MHMIILSIGMPRAGSGWFYNLSNDLVVANGGQNARHIRQRYHLQSILTEVNCNIGALTLPRLIAVLIPSFMGNTYVIKAHSKPTPIALSFIQRGWILPTHIFRDPRDAMLSAMENGQKAIERGSPNAFSPFATFDNALKFMSGYVHTTLSWLECKFALQTHYEDLLLNFDDESNHLIDFLSIKKNNPEILKVIEKYRPEKVQTEQRGLHFSHGRIGRFRQKMDKEQQEVLVNTLGPYLERMGYAV